MHAFGVQLAAVPSQRCVRRRCCYSAPRWASAMSDPIITLASLSQTARHTLESPPRVSVYDVIAAAKGCSANAAGMVFRRLLQAGLVPQCADVTQNLIHTDRLNQESHGGPRRPVVVATAAEMVQILWALPVTGGLPLAVVPKTSKPRTKTSKPSLQRLKPSPKTSKPSPQNPQSTP